MLYEFGSYRLDTVKRQLERHEEVVPLTPKSFELLCLFLESDGRALSRTELIQALWPDSFVEEANLSFQISVLRKILGEDGAKWIETVPRHGYRFTATVKRPSPTDTDVPTHSPPAEERWKRRTSLWRFAGVGAVGVLAVFGAMRFAGRWSPVSKDSTIISPAVPLTAWPGHQQSPSLSPDGSQVAFSWDGPGSENYDIYVKLVGPGEPVRITTDSAIDDQPAWSPDGRFIAFLRSRSEIHADLFVIPALGGAERKVASVSFQGRGSNSASNLEWTGNLAWTPDGKWLAFGGAPSDNEIPGIWLVALNSGEKRRLTTVSPPDFGDWARRLRRDGRYMAFIRERTLSTSTVYVNAVVATGSGRTAAKGEFRGGQHPVSPGSRTAVASCCRRQDISASRACTASHSGQAGQRIPRDLRRSRSVERARGISVAKNGRIVYDAQFRDANLWRADLASSNRTAARTGCCFYTG